MGLSLCGQPARCFPFISPIGVNTIQEGSFLTLHYRLAGPDGADVINTFADKPATLSLGAGQLAPAMERRLIGLPEGARQVFSLAAGEAFGDRNPQMLQRVKRSLLAELMQRAEAAGVRKLIAVIGDSANQGSIGVHQSVGFTHVGLLKSCGWKFDRWLDVVLMDKALGAGDSSAPDSN